MHSSYSIYYPNTFPCTNFYLPPLLTTLCSLPLIIPCYLTLACHRLEYAILQIQMPVSGLSGGIIMLLSHILSYNSPDLQFFAPTKDWGESKFALVKWCIWYTLGIELLTFGSVWICSPTSSPLDYASNSCQHANSFRYH